MSIGDVNSMERGTGARFNTGKIAYELLPLRTVLDIIKWEARDRHLMHMVEHLADWQAGDDDALDRAIESIMPVPGPWLDTFADASRVFDYGRKKYAAWNWAKGMPWSVPLGCAIRHALKELDGQELDDESGLPHRGHIHCNLLMLKQYALSYPEGDDRPVKWLGIMPAAALDSVSMDPPVHAADASTQHGQARKLYDAQTLRDVAWSAKRDDLPPNLAAAVKTPLEPTRIATPAELADLRQLLSAEELKGFGIGDVEPRHPMAAEALRQADEFNLGSGETGV